MKGDPLDLDSLVEPVYRNDIVSLHDRLAFNTNVREKREGIGRRPRTQDIRPLLTQANTYAAAFVCRGQIAQPPFRFLPALRACAPEGEVDRRATHVKPPCDVETDAKAVSVGR